MLVVQPSGRDKGSCKLEVSLEYIISSSSKKEKKKTVTKRKIKKEAYIFNLPQW